MTVVCYALDAVAGAPAYTGRMLRETLSVFAGGATSARPLGCYSGVRPGTPSNTISLSGLNWTCKTHAGALDVEAAAEAGPYLYAVTVNETGTLNVAHATLDRVDILYTQISDPAEVDGTSVPKAEVKYFAGTAGSGQPATPARSMLLATFAVPHTGAGSPTATWVAPTLFAAGARASVTTVANLALLTAYTNMEATVEATPGVFWKYNGSAWVMYGVARFASSSARNTAIPSPVTGMESKLDTERFKRYYNGSTWKPDLGAGFIPILPTGVSGTGVTLGTDGAVTCAGGSTTSVAIDGVFTSDFEAYQIIIDLTTTGAAATIDMVLRIAGVDTTSGYDRSRTGGTGTGGTATTLQSGNTGSWVILAAALTGRHQIIIDLFRPQLATQTTALYVAGAIDNPMTTAAAQAQGTLQQRSIFQFDGFKISVPTNAILGTIRVLGRNNI